MEASSLMSSWMGLTLTGAPSEAAADSPLWMSREARRIWWLGRAARDLTISKPMPALPPLRGVGRVSEVSGRGMKKYMFRPGC